MDKNLTFLVVSYDGYSDMWDVFFECKEKFWKDCPYEFILANNTINYRREGVRVVNCGKNAQWSTRTRLGLEAINTPYVCFLLEDFFLSENIDNTLIEEAINLMKSDDIKYYKLLSLSKIKTSRYKNYSGLRVIPSDLKYGVSLLAAIWERKHFLEIIGPDDYNPWRFEIERNEETNNREGVIAGVYDERNILNICHMVVQGKYLPSAVRTMTKKNIKIPISTRGVHSVFFEFRNKLKDIFYPVFRKSKLLTCFADHVGINTVTKKNKKN